MICNKYSTTKTSCWTRKFGSPTETYTPSQIYAPEPESDPDDPRKKTYLIPKTTEIYGGFRGYTSPEEPGETARNQRNPEANLTVLNGDFAGDDLESAFPNGTTYNDNFYHVVTLPDTDIQISPTRLSGFIIRGGYANGPAVWGHHLGGAIKSKLLVESGLEGAQFNRLHVKFNYAEGGGGGIYIEAKEEHYDIANCRFERNYVAGGDAGAGLMMRFASITLMNCVFFQNHAAAGNGGGVAIAGGYSESEFGQTSASLINCTFSENTASDGGAIWGTSGTSKICLSHASRTQLPGATPHPRCSRSPERP